VRATDTKVRYGVTQGYPGAVAAAHRGPAFSAVSSRAGPGGLPGGSAAPPRKAAPPVGGKTIKVKNNFMLHKDSMKLEPVEEGAKQELTFTFDAEIAGEAQIFWDCVDMTVPEVLQDPKQLQRLGLDLQREKASAKPKWFKFPVRSHCWLALCLFQLLLPYTNICEAAICSPPRRADSNRQDA
jgi:hypothetical protein